LAVLSGCNHAAEHLQQAGQAAAFGINRGVAVFGVEGGDLRRGEFYHQRFRVDGGQWHLQ
jgi:hypothetical protein